MTVFLPDETAHQAADRNSNITGCNPAVDVQVTAGTDGDAARRAAIADIQITIPVDGGAVRNAVAVDMSL